MIKINLLPIRQIKKRTRLRNEVVGLVLVFFVVLLGIGAVGYSQAAKIDSLNKEIAALNAKKSSFAPVLKEIKELTSIKESLETKIDTIKKLRKGSKLPVRIIDEIANLTPSGKLWLSSFSEGGGAITLQGTALDNATVAQYMKSLEASEYFADAELKNSALKNVGGRSLASFNLTVAIVTPGMDSDNINK